MVDGETRRYAATLARRYLNATMTGEALLGQFAGPNDPLIQELLIAIAHEPGRGFFGVSERQWERQFSIPMSSLLAELEKGEEGDLANVRSVPKASRRGLLLLSLLTLWTGALAIEHLIKGLQDSASPWGVTLHGIGALLFALMAAAGASWFRQQLTLYRFVRMIRKDGAGNVRR